MMKDTRSEGRRAGSADRGGLNGIDNIIRSCDQRSPRVVIWDIKSLGYQGSGKFVAVRWWTNLKAWEASETSDAEVVAKAAAAAAEARADSELTEEQMAQEVEFLSLAASSASCLL